VKWSRARTADKEANAKTAGAAVFARTAREEALAKSAEAAVGEETQNNRTLVKTQSFAHDLFLILCCHVFILFIFSIILFDNVSLFV
jgi:hypothetical protein